MVDQTIGILEPSSPPATKQLDTDQVTNVAGTPVQQERVVTRERDEDLHMYLDTMTKLLLDIRAQLAELCPEATLTDIDEQLTGDATSTDDP